MSITKNLGYNLLLRISNIAFPILTFPYITRVFDIEGLGKYSFTYAYFHYFALIALLGIPIYGIQAISRVRKNQKALNRTFSELLVIGFIASFASTLIYILSVFSISRLSENWSLYLIAVPAIFTSFLQLDWFFSGIEKFKVIAIRNIVIRFLTVVLMFLFVKNPEDYTIYFLLVIISVVLTHIINIREALKYIEITFKNLNLVRHFKPVLTLFAAFIAVSIYAKLDTIMLGFLSSDESVGLYTVSIKITRIIIVVVTALTPVIIPKIMDALQSGSKESLNKIIQNSHDYVFFTAIPIFVGLLLIAPNLIAVFAGKGYEQSLTSLMILSPIVLLIGLNNIYNVQILVSRKKEKFMLRSVLAGAGLNFVLNLILIPKYHEIGASVATVLSEALVTAIAFYYATKNLKFKVKFSSFLKPILAVLPFVILIGIFKNYFSSDLSILVASVLGCSLMYIVLMKFVLKSPLFSTIRSNFMN